MSKAKVARPNRTPPSTNGTPGGITLADVHLWRTQGDKTTQMTGGELALAVTVAEGMQRDKYLDHDETSCEIRGVAAGLRVLAMASEGDEGQAMDGAARYLDHLADRVDDLRFVPAKGDPAAWAAKYELRWAPKKQGGVA